MKTSQSFKPFRLTAHVAIAALLLLWATSCRRELWVFQDNFKQVELYVDWRNYFRDQTLYPATPNPTGMTVWFFPKDGSHSFRYTTDEVRHYEYYLSKGEYDGLVIDYSPEEYGHQEFTGMDHASTAKVQATASSYQPDSIAELFGEAAYGHTLPWKNVHGLYGVAWEPENIASDTIQMSISTGKYDRYIPYDERKAYQASLVKQCYEAEPLIIPWNMRIRVYIRGIYYLYNIQASVAGLADGYYLVDCKTSNTPCLLQLNNWEVHADRDSNAVEGGYGYIAKTFKTWGPLNFSNRDYDIRQEQQPLVLQGRQPDEVRLNLRFLLRDRKTVVYYHFDMANMMRVYQNEYALRIDLTGDDPRVPVLPYAEPYNGVEFDGLVVPWQEGNEVELSM